VAAARAAWESAKQDLARVKLELHAIWLTFSGITSRPVDSAPVQNGDCCRVRTGVKMYQANYQKWRGVPAGADLAADAVSA